MHKDRLTNGVRNVDVERERKRERDKTALLAMFIRPGPATCLHTSTGC